MTGGLCEDWFYNIERKKLSNEIVSYFLEGFTREGEALYMKRLVEV